MFQKLLALIKKHKDILLYLIFGVLTTLVNYAVYLPLYHYAGTSAALSNALAWVAAVAFAFLTNKPFVFQSHDWRLKTLLPELGKFLGCRVFSGLAETAILFVAVDLLHGNATAWKLITSVLVVIANYVASKLLVFKST